MHAYVECSSYAGNTNVRFDCIVTRGEPPSIALGVSAKRFPRGRGTQIFRDAVREYLANAKVPVREIWVVKHGGHVTWPRFVLGVAGGRSEGRQATNYSRGAMIILVTAAEVN